MSVRFGNSDAQVIIHGDQERALRRMLDKITRGSRKILTNKVSDVRQKAEKRWPVGARRPNHSKPASVPHSADMFSNGERVSRDQDGAYYGAYVANSASYIYYIKSAKIGNGKSKRHAWTTLVRKPMRHADKTFNDLAKQTATMMGRE